MGKLWLAVGGLAVLLLAGSIGAGAQPAAAGGSARAYAIKVVVPGQPGATAGSVVAPPDAVALGAGFAYPADGSVVSSGALAASASTGVGAASASAGASSEVQSLSLFGGEITASTVVSRASAEATSRGAGGDLSGASVSGLVVLGQAIEGPAPGTRITLGDWGYLLVLAQGAAPAANGYRGFVTSLELHLSVDHGGLPAGSAIYVGFAEASVAALPPAERPARPPATTPAPPGARPQGASANAAGKRRSALRGARRPLPSLDVELTPGGYVFPVHGPASFADTFGADRAVVVWHHGEDIIAPLGAPVLAVADGTVFSVGWNDLGGNRLWLRDLNGNEFYYAHLSAFSPLAVDGARVKAGDVLGFVGNSGDAEATPPHLHFEIHPVSLLGLGYDGVINPYKYLLAWRRLEDVRFIAGAAWLPALRPSTAPQPGAYLLSARDISSLSGLEPGSLRRALAPQPSTELP
ncbi:MAG: M23 family metallopeptidase [Thermoleophilia bacterium]|nr:M23 family metallopeptidase [Thermoleophilia bacterium]